MIVCKDNAVYFDEGPGSNFHPAPIFIMCPMRFHIIELPDTETGFQAYKVTICAKGTLEMYDAICQAGSPKQAKHLGGQVPLSPEERTLWDRQVAPRVMLECCIAKFQQKQNLECWLWLQGTGDDRLVEHRRDRIWGDGLDGSGKNLLGKILELVRALTRS